MFTRLGLLVLLCTAPALAQPAAGPTEPSDEPAAAPGTVTIALGHGVEVVSADERTRLALRARMQLRFSQLSEDPGDPPDVTEFQARRVRLLVEGHVLGEEVTYYLQLGFSNADTEPDLRSPLRDAYLTWARLRDLHVRGGQMKVPFGRQRVNSSSALQLVDRSIVVGELNLDRDVGVQVMSDDLFGWGGRLGYHLGLFSGDGRNRLASAPGVLVVARIVLKPLGGFDDLVEADLARSRTPKLAIGLGAARNQNTNRERSTFGTPYTFARFDYTHAAADVTLRYRGLSVSSELIYRSPDRDFSEQTTPDGELVRELARGAWGYFVQAGYLATTRFEVTARFGELRPVGEGAPDLAARRRELGGGLSWYLAAHDLKLQTDYFYLPTEGRGNEHQIRAQTQLYF